MTPLAAAGAPGSTRARSYEIIFGHETFGGKAFDVILLIAIVLSVATVILESVQGLRSDYGGVFLGLEVAFTVVFTLEYVVRLWCVDRPARYALSFFGLIDFMAVLPTYLSLFVPGGQVLAVVRILRVLRVFRVLKLGRYMGAAAVLTTALRASRFKISVFLLAVMSIVVVVGSLMYLIEGPATGFTSIPRGVYWAIVTLTTVGYGDIAPTTPAGQILASMVMILGYAIIAVPTGIVTAEITAARLPPSSSVRACTSCGFGEPDDAAAFCRACGAKLN
ncbi:MAG: ion transporter [Gemmatimonadetes bacterium]|jgi:voltage-gated potassium channel|nr:ion transporter [Gemmatimonadota bacterium]